MRQRTQEISSSGETKRF